MNTRIRSIGMGLSVLLTGLVLGSNQKAFAQDGTRTTKARLAMKVCSLKFLVVCLLVWICFFIGLSASAQNEAIGRVQSGADIHSVSNNSLSVVGTFAELNVPYVWAKTTAVFGFNKVEYQFSVPTNENGVPIMDANVDIQSIWTDTFTISGGTGAGTAIFRFQAESAGVHPQGDRGFVIISKDPGPNSPPHDSQVW